MKFGYSTEEERRSDHWEENVCPLLLNCSCLSLRSEYKNREGWGKPLFLVGKLVLLYYAALLVLICHAWFLLAEGLKEQMEYAANLFRNRSDAVFRFFSQNFLKENLANLEY